MKKIRLFAVLSLSVFLCLSGCGDSPEKTNVVEEVTLENKEEIIPDNSTPSVIVENDTPPAEGMARSRLTNEWVTTEIGGLRPLAVMIPNDRSALPQ